MTSGSAKTFQTAVSRDALCELVNVSSGNALTSLSRLIGGGRISLAVPSCVAATEAGELPGLDADGIVVRMEVDGVVALTLLAAFDGASALRLAQILLVADQTPAELGETEESAILEAVNIFSCSFLGALGRLLRGGLVPTPPRATYGHLREVVAQLVEEPDETAVVCSSFEAAGGSFSGRILVVVDREATSRMLEAAGAGG